MGLFFLLLIMGTKGEHTRLYVLCFLCRFLFLNNSLVAVECLASLASRVLSCVRLGGWGGLVAYIPCVYWRGRRLLWGLEGCVWVGVGTFLLSVIVHLSEFRKSS
ncbi:hypothetical protein B0T19DRAFT_12882 [Cercophora scortea]|uniref:Uncharacterized protein n=1 Tax=Cercophora scortea TaxID=314031 RepID=A0AAE0J313_9PEZI|nr:hypothetical protein B0T19DRAFT_12882 [Cercophora scortea]